MLLIFQKLQSNKSKLEDEIKLWEGIEMNQGEITQWLEPMVAKLEESVNQFSNATNVPDLLHKYKVSVPSIQNDLFMYYQ